MNLLVYIIVKYFHSDYCVISIHLLLQFSVNGLSIYKYCTVDPIIFTDEHSIRAILRVPLAVDTKICGVSLIQIVHLVFRAMDIFVLFSLGMTSSLRTNIQS